MLNFFMFILYLNQLNLIISISKHFYYLILGLGAPAKLLLTFIIPSIYY